MNLMIFIVQMKKKLEELDLFAPQRKLAQNGNIMHRRESRRFLTNGAWLPLITISEK